MLKHLGVKTELLKGRTPAGDWGTWTLMLTYPLMGKDHTAVEISNRPNDRANSQRLYLQILCLQIPPNTDQALDKESCLCANSETFPSPVTA